MSFDRLKRRELIALLGGAAAWPIVARAQGSAKPAIGYLSVRTLKTEASLLAAFRQGLGAGGFVEGQSLSIEYRFADGRYEQLPAMAADLARRQVAVIFAGGGTAAAAKAATSTIPIVFSGNTDPVQSGLVASFNRPGGNITGVSNLSGDVTEKRLQLLHDLIPTASTIGYLINPSAPIDLEALRRRGQAAAASLGLDVRFLEAGETVPQPDLPVEVVHRERAVRREVGAGALDRLLGEQVALEPDGRLSGDEGDRVRQRQQDQVVVAVGLLEEGAPVVADNETASARGLAAQARLERLAMPLASVRATGRFS